MVATLHSTKVLTYGDLPEHPPENVYLVCPECDALTDFGFSAQRGDYWDIPDDRPIICCHCGENMEMVRVVTVLEAWRAR